MNSMCKNKPGGFDCECQAGYKKENDSCVDVNECEDKKDNKCDPKAECTNKEPMYSCACKDGDIGNGFQCVSADPCDRNVTCEANSSCEVNAEGRAQCVCDGGFIRRGTQCEGENLMSCDRVGIICMFIVGVFSVFQWQMSAFWELTNVTTILRTVLMRKHPIDVSARKGTSVSMVSVLTKMSVIQQSQSLKGNAAVLVENVKILQEALSARVRQRRLPMVRTIF